MLCKHVWDLKADWLCRADRNRRQPFTTWECEKRKDSKLSLKGRVFFSLHCAWRARENVEFKRSTSLSNTCIFTFNLTSVGKVKIKKCHPPKKNNQIAYLSFWYNSQVSNMDKALLPWEWLWFQKNLVLQLLLGEAIEIRHNILSFSSACEQEHC